MSNATLANQLYSDSIYTCQQIGLLKVHNLRSDILKTGTITIKDGSITGLSDPIDDDQASSRNYLIRKRPVPVGPVNSVQLEQDDLLSYSPSLTFDGTTLSFDKLTNNDVTIENGTITGLITGSQYNSAATKDYIDSIFNLHTTNIYINSDITYSPTIMIYGIIYRDSLTSLLRTDTTASAVSIISEFPDTSIGNSAYMFIKNNSSNNDSVIRIVPGTGVSFSTIDQEIYLHSSYILKCLLIITGISTVMIYPESISFSGSQTSSKITNVVSPLRPYALNSLFTDTLVVSDVLWKTYYDDTLLNTSNLSISWQSILNGQGSRSGLISDITMYFPEPAGSLFNEISRYEYIFRNADPIYSITLSNSNTWHFEPFTLGPRTSVLLWFLINEEHIDVSIIGKFNF